MRSVRVFSVARLFALSILLVTAGPGTRADRSAAVVERRARRSRRSSSSSRRPRRRRASPKFVPPAERIATFDQDGTLWVEHPMYTQVMYCLERVPAVVKAQAGAGERRAVQDRAVRRPRGDRQAADDGPREDPRRHADRHVGRRVPRRSEEVDRDGQGPALEAAVHRADLSADAGGAADTCAPTATRPTSSPAAARTSCASYAEEIYGIPPEQVVGTAGGTKYGYDKDGKPILTKEPKLLLNDDNAGKPEGIHLMIGRRPYAAFGNSTGDQQMLEYTQAGDGARLAMLVLHDDAKREYAYGPAQGLPDTKVGAFTAGALRRGEEKGWVVISMKNDWKRIFAFEP